MVPGSLSWLPEADIITVQSTYYVFSPFEFFQQLSLDFVTKSLWLVVTIVTVMELLDVLINK